MRGSTVIYERAYKKIHSISNKDRQLEALNGLLEYGLYGRIPKTDDSVVNEIYNVELPYIKGAIERREVSISNGRKGGRPAGTPTEEIFKMRQEGMTNKQIAEKIGCTVKNIEKRLSTARKRGTLPNTNYTTNQTSGVSGASQPIPTNNPTNQSGLNSRVTQPIPTNHPNNTTNQQDSGTQPTIKTPLTQNNQGKSTVSDRQGNQNPTNATNPNNLTNNIIYNASNVESSNNVNTANINGVRDANGNFVGRRIRHLSEAEAKEIKAKIAQGVKYTDLDREYGMIPGTINGNFSEYWKQYVFAKVNGRVG